MEIYPILTNFKLNLMLESLKVTQIRNSNYSGWVGEWVANWISGNIDHLNPIEVEVEVEIGLGLSLAKSNLLNHIYELNLLN